MKYEVDIARPIGLVNRMHLKKRKNLRKNRRLRCKMAVGFPIGEIPEYLSFRDKLIPLDSDLFNVK